MYYHYDKYADALRKNGLTIDNARDYTREALKFLKRNLDKMKDTTIGKTVRTDANGKVIKALPGKKATEGNIFGIFDEALDKIVNFGAK